MFGSPSINTQKEAEKIEEEIDNKERTLIMNRRGEKM
jgi:hypothetical protein